MAELPIPRRSCHGGLAASGCGKPATKVIFESMEHLGGAVATVTVEEFFMEWVQKVPRG